MSPADETRGPGYDPDAADLPWYRRAVRQGGGYFVPNLAFLILPAWFSRGVLDAGQMSVLIVALVAIGLVFLGVTLAVEWRETLRWLWLALLISLIAMTAFIAGDASFLAYYSPFVGASTALLVAWRSARVVIGAVTLFALAMAALERDILAAVLGLISAMIGFSVSQGLEAQRMAVQLRDAEERTAVLAVAAERERIGRDLHDILGHSLTTIAIKADLASRLATRDGEAAKRESDEIGAIARQALADVRATASGIREVRLATEIASGRAVLEAAGILAHTPSSLPPLNDDDAELLGYVVREAITNVLRHSDASNCHIEVGEGLVEVRDDGVGLAPGAPRSGLEGLEQRLVEAGWGLCVGGESGTTIRAERNDP